MRYDLNILGVQFEFDAPSAVIDLIKANFPSSGNYHLQKRYFKYGVPSDFCGKYFHLFDVSFFQSDITNYFQIPGEPDFDQVLLFLNWFRYNICYALKDRFFAYHSALIRFEGRLFAIAGPSGSGKTTTAHRMILKGGEYLSDEYLLLGDDGISYIPRPLYMPERFFASKEFYNSKILGEKMAPALPPASEIMLFPPEKITLILPHRGDRFPQEAVIHPFDFYTSDNFREALELMERYFDPGILNIKWSNTEDIDGFIETL